jgi:glutamate--cysteine ligase catalytic subunit
MDENMKRAHHRDAVHKEKFYFRKNIMPHQEKLGPVEDEYDLFTINEIINGKEDGSFPGLIPIIYSYLNSINMDIEMGCRFSRYLGLIKSRANGTLVTTASWIRRFVQSHPDYKKDSVVSQEINYDLITTMDKIGRGELHVPELLGNFSKREK